jgi:hypothetical protein
MGFMVIDGEASEKMTTLVQKTPSQAFIISEASSSRARENFIVSIGRKFKAGEVAHFEDAVDLTTTAHTHSNTVLDVLAATTGLVVGDIYHITGAGIPDGTTFTYGGSSAGTLSVAATATATGVSVHITRDAGLGPWTNSGDTVIGISLYDIDATLGEKFGSFVARDAEVNLKMLIFPGSDGDDFGPIGEAITALAELDIICRD